METIELAQRLSVALAIGLLIGLERGWQTRSEPEGERAAGLRTHALAALLGGVWGAIALRLQDGAAVALALAFCAVSAAIVLFRWRECEHDRTFGATTVVAAMLAFSLGALAAVGDMQVAAAAGIVVTALLALKSALHEWIRRLTWAELRSALTLLAMTFVLLPLLPHRPIDPWGAIDPFEIWLMTILIAAIAFAGYVAIKLAGETAGILITGLAGGLASSTAVTLTLARFAPAHPASRAPLLAGTLLAGAVMLARVLAVLAAFNTALLLRLALPLGTATAGLAIAGLALARVGAPAADGTPPLLDVKNPLDMAMVLRFGMLLLAVTALARIAAHGAGPAGVYLLSSLSGIADVDAITLSMARQAGSGLAVEVAARAVAIAVCVNTIAKAVLGWIAGGRAFGLPLLAISAAVALVIAVTFVSSGEV